MAICKLIVLQELDKEVQSVFIAVKMQVHILKNKLFHRMHTV